MRKIFLLMACGGGEIPETPQLSYGQKTAGVGFNPSKDNKIDTCKQLHANLIDEANNLRNQTDNAEVKRMCSIAITYLQEAQMWAVKALTWQH